MQIRFSALSINNFLIKKLKGKQNMYCYLLFWQDDACCATLQRKQQQRPSNKQGGTAILQPDVPEGQEGLRSPGGESRENLP